jgi:PAS domain S-box-containing protein
MTVLRYFKLNGTEFDAEVQETPIIYDGLQCIHASMQDITEHTRIEKLLQTSEAKYSSMIANISDVIGIMGADALIRYVSPNYEKWFGWLPEEVVGTSGFSNIHPDDIAHVKGAFDEILKKGKAINTTQFRNKCKDGSYKPTELTASNLLDNPEIKGILTNFRDISERKQIEQKIKLQNEELQKLNAEKDKFFSIIAHDLRGPMGGFMQLTELLVDESHNLTGSEIKELMIDLSQSSRNTFNLLENLLEWSQISSGHLDFKPERVGLNEVVTASIHILAEQAREKGIKIVKAMTNDPKVTADKNMLKSIISNLLTNAIKFTACGGTVTISAKSVENNQTLISVRDTGIGMSEEMKDNLFRIDANTKRPGTQGERSTGLGLLLCKEFVEKHGGKISVESRQRMGSVFSFTLPSANEIWPKKNEEIKEKLQVGKMSSLKNLNILVVEDDDISFKLISVMVKGFSSHLYRAKTGYEAVDVFGQTPGIDLIIMDIKMPEMDGFEATREIRLLNQEVIILAVTTFSMPSDRENSIEAGCNDYMAKPIQPDVFLKMVKKYMI